MNHFKKKALFGNVDFKQIILKLILRKLIHIIQYITIQKLIKHITYILLFKMKAK